MFIQNVWAHRWLVLRLAISDFKMRFLGSSLGILWAFLLPLINIFVMWFAFEMGFKTKKVGNVPFILWLATGFCPWSFFSEFVIVGSQSIREKSFLVKKMVFPVELLPLIKALSSSIVLVFLTMVCMTLFLLYGHRPVLTWFQIPYYMLCVFCLGLVVVQPISAVVVFYIDALMLTNVLVQIGFWITPIFWSYDFLPEWAKLYVDLNPMSYIVNGFRDSFMTEVWFWQHGWETLYFWAFILFFEWAGMFLFRRLRPYFADVI